MLSDRILLHSYHLYPKFFLHFRRIWNVFSCFLIQHIRKSIQQVVPACLLPNIQSWPVGGKGIWRGSYSVVQEWARFSLGLLALFQQVEALFQRGKFSVLFQPLGERALMDSRFNWDFTHLIHFSKTANYIALTAIHKSRYQFAKCYLLSNCYARSWEYLIKKKKKHDQCACCCRIYNPAGNYRQRKSICPPYWNIRMPDPGSTKEKF